MVAAGVTVKVVIGTGFTVTGILSVKVEVQLPAGIFIAFTLSVVLLDKAPELRIIVPPVPLMEAPVVEAPLYNW